MDFWCHASALLALSWARACDSDLIKRRMLVRAAAAACAHGQERTVVSQKRGHFLSTSWSWLLVRTPAPYTLTHLL